MFLKTKWLIISQFDKLFLSVYALFYIDYCMYIKF